nr:hypothetical protein [Chromobacterium sp. ASV5]
MGMLLGAIATTLAMQKLRHPVRMSWHAIILVQVILGCGVGLSAQGISLTAQEDGLLAGASLPVCLALQFSARCA